MLLLFQCGLSSKARDIEDPSSVYKTVEEIFNLQQDSYFLQWMNPDFGEFVDLEDVNDIKHLTKIRVITVDTIETPENLEIQDVSMSNSEVVPTKTPENLETYINTAFKSKQWPSNVSLPTESFSKPLLNALSEKKDLNWTLSSELVEHLSRYIYSYKKYPSKAERTEVCNVLISSYPYLKNDVGIGTGGWEVKILNKLKRLRQEDSSVEVKLNREKRKSEKYNVPKKINLNPEKGEINWAPDHMSGETEKSQELHRQLLKEESLKNETLQNKTLIKSLMNITYSFRRDEINRKIPISRLIKEYPLFFQHQEQFDEFERLTAVNVRLVLTSEIQKYGRSLLDIFLKKQCKDLKPLQDKVEKVLEETKDNEVYVTEQVKNHLGIYILPCLLKEKVEFFIEEVSLTFYY